MMTRFWPHIDFIVYIFQRCKKSGTVQQPTAHSDAGLNNSIIIAMAFNNLACIDFLGEPSLYEAENENYFGKFQNLHPARYRGRNTLKKLRADDQDSVETVCSIVTGPGFDRYWEKRFCGFPYFCFCFELDLLFDEDHYILVRGSDMFVFPGHDVLNDDTKPRHKIDLRDNRIHRDPFSDKDGPITFFIHDQEGERLYFLDVQDRFMAQSFEDAFQRGGVPVSVRGNDEENEVTLAEGGNN